MTAPAVRGRVPAEAARHCEITDRERLHTYLQTALRLEHATIPPYLTALYSIRPGTNGDAYHVLRVAVVEEMLHLTLVANLLNAVCGDPDLTVDGFVPVYPTYLPDGEDDFTVDIRAFSLDCIESFKQIERPGTAPEHEQRHVARTQRSDPQSAGEQLGAVPCNEEMQFWSIGEFYAEIAHGLQRLHEDVGDELFSGPPERQVGPEYFYSGGGSVLRVTDLESALAAIRLITEQGEGLGGGIFDSQGELSHYYRFEQLTSGRYYLEGDEPHAPTGPALAVDWTAAYPIQRNPRLAAYPGGSELHAAALDFNRAYADFLALLTRAFTGHPALLLEAVPEMFRLRDRMTALMHNPVPGLDGVMGAPTFEIPAVVRAERS